MPDHANEHDGDTDPAETNITASDGSTDQPDPSKGESSGSTIGLGDAQKHAREAATNLIEHEFEGVIKIESTDSGWRTVVEVIERGAVPDTQDIIGRYEIKLDTTGSATSYELLERYRRGEMKEEL